MVQSDFLFLIEGKIIQIYYMRDTFPVSQLTLHMKSIFQILEKCSYRYLVLSYVWFMLLRR